MTKDLIDVFHNMEVVYRRTASSGAISIHTHSTGELGVGRHVVDGGGDGEHLPS